MACLGFCHCCFHTFVPSYIWRHFTWRIRRPCYADYLLDAGSCLRLQQQSQTYLNFLNQLLQFEKRHGAFLYLQLEQRYWTNKGCCKFGIFLIRIFSTTMRILQVVVPTSFVIHPYCSWKILPSSFLDAFTFFNFDGQAGIIVTEIARRIFSFAQACFIIYLVANRYLLVLAVSLFMAQGALILMVLTFKRFLIKHCCNKADIRRTRVTVLMYREIQLLCGIYNEIHKMILTPSLILSFVVGITVSLFMLMSGSVEQNMQNLLLFGTAGLQSICAVLSLIHTEPATPRCGNFLKPQRHDARSYRKKDALQTPATTF